jgi:DNA mismatch repair protein MutS
MVPKALSKMGKTTEWVPMGARELPRLIVITPQKLPPAEKKLSDITPPKLTPMMQQWLQAKTQFEDAILLFRMGDFYELFGEDAEVAAPLLDLTLTSRDKDKTGLKMAGFPFHAAENYIAKLVGQGLKVAVCEQLEDPKDKKGIVKRGITEVITPGTMLHGEDSSLAQSYLVAVSHYQEMYSLAAVDFLSSRFVVMSEKKERMMEELKRLAPSEIIYNEADREAKALAEAVAVNLRVDGQVRLEAFLSSVPVSEPLDNKFTWGEAVAVQLIKGFVIKLKGHWPSHLGLPAQMPKSQLFIDHATALNLDLMPRKKGDTCNLFSYLGPCKTPMGRRLLAQCITSPSADLQEISKNHDLVEDFLAHPAYTSTFREHLGSLCDWQKLCALAANNRLGPRGLGRLRDSLKLLPKLAPVGGHNAGVAARLAGLPDLAPLALKLDQALNDELPGQLKDGEVFREGYCPELAEFYELSLGGQNLLLALEKSEQEKTGISSLKIKFTRVFGYYIEITKTHLHKVPAHYLRKQTIANGERFTISELSDLEIKLNSAKDQIQTLEAKLYQELICEVVTWSDQLMEASRIIAHLDMLSQFAQNALTFTHVRPRMLPCEEKLIDIKKGRHPMAEVARLTQGQYYVPNDIRLDGNDCLIALITGPNMAGKSTIMRQVAILQIMAQLGAFVPAQSASLSICDAIFARVGASDDLATGRSTFMVEMSETAYILQEATVHSLVLLDEIGRGTSTYDGVALAQAVAEYLHDVVKVRTIFATHYHELTDLEDTLKHLKNFHVEVDENLSKIDFLYTLARGPSGRSFGIAVAKLAGLPPAVIERASTVLRTYEPSADVKPTLAAPVPKPQLDFFAAHQSRNDIDVLVEELMKLDVNRITGLQALNKINAWKMAIKRSDASFLANISN